MCMMFYCVWYVTITFLAAATVSGALYILVFKTHCLVKSKLQKLQCVVLQVVGSHQLSPEGREKAMKRREKVAANEHKSSATERAEAQQLKRQEKQQEQMVCPRSSLHHWSINQSLYKVKKQVSRLFMPAVYTVLLPSVCIAVALRE